MTDAAEPAPGHPSNARIEVDLEGVPETMLWPLWHRVGISPGGTLLVDPMAADLVARIDYPFEAHFGKPSIFHAIRARHCDELIKAYIAAQGADATVVALGEGLETQLWRLDDPAAAWYTVDLPEAIAVRKQLLPEHANAELIACSALDTAWMDRLPEGSRPFVTAAGLMMYFTADEIQTLLREIARRFPGAELFFDTIPRYFSARSMRGFQVTKAYKAPQMPWGLRWTTCPIFLPHVTGSRSPY